MSRLAPVLRTIASKRRLPSMISRRATRVQRSPMTSRALLIEQFLMVVKSNVARYVVDHS
ncbi:Uncharacterised protein [Mycobacteroides abscessus subsp. abscessus]|nr:Uncharacterised protein [Mycobacteroides abscessus subsp. abscessus]